MEFAAPVPILRMFDEHKAREFYLDYLGFEVVFEHRFEPGTPLYMGLSRGACMLHLSGHHGDCAPGGVSSSSTASSPAHHSTWASRAARACST
jgi:hypothetical protein